MSARTEFPDYPSERLPPIPEGWTDMSWCNDACPCFGTGDVIVFVDFPEPSEREYPETKRFSVVSNPESANTEVLLHTDDWAEVLTFVSARAAAVPATV